VLVPGNVVVNGTEFTVLGGNIPARAAQRLSVRSAAESGVRLVFDASTNRGDSGEQWDFETGEGRKVEVRSGQI
jgi:hypothetical protein